MLFAGLGPPSADVGPAQEYVRQNHFKIWWENTILTSKLLQDVRTKEILPDLLLREINSITMNNYIWTQLAHWHRRTPPTWELLQDMRGKIQSQHQNCFKMWGKNSRTPPTSELLHNVREKSITSHHQKCFKRQERYDTKKRTTNREHHHITKLVTYI